MIAERKNKRWLVLEYLVFCCPQSIVRDLLIFLGSISSWVVACQKFQGSKFLVGVDLMFSLPWETGSSFLNNGV